MIKIGVRVQEKEHLATDKLTMYKRISRLTQHSTISWPRPNFMGTSAELGN